jgi:uncharacterized OsmC-like protein
MDADMLRAVQAPIKAGYRERPDTARIPAGATAILDLSDIACDVPDWHGTTKAGLHPAAGGSGELACSADMLLQALAACAGVTLRAVAIAMGISLRAGRVVVEGVWDARGTLGVDRAAPVGLTDIAVRFEIDSDADPAKLERLVATTERYCVIFQTLRTPPTLSTTLGTFA